LQWGGEGESGEMFHRWRWGRLWFIAVIARRWEARDGVFIAVIARSREG